MRRLLSLGFSQGISSSFPILMWFLIGVIYGDADYTNLFTITYSFQFIWSFLYSLVIKGAVIHKKKHAITSDNSYWTAVLLSVCIFALICGGFVYKHEVLFSFFNIGDKYFGFYVFSLFCLCCNLLTAGIVTLLQFEDKHKEASKVMLVAYSIQVAVITLTGLVFQREVWCIILSCLLLVLLCGWFLRKYVHFTAVDMRFLQGLKYRIQSTTGNVSMYIIYLFGVGSISGFGSMTLFTYNMLAMCTDVQWDIQASAIDSDTSIWVCEKQFLAKRFHLYRNAILLGFLLLGSSGVMLFVISRIYVLDHSYLMALFLFEMSSFLAYCIRDVFLAYINIEHPSIWLMVISIVCYVLRIIVSLSWHSKYALSVGVLVGSVSCVFYYVLYLAKLRQSNAPLVQRKKTCLP